MNAKTNMKGGISNPMKNANSEQAQKPPHQAAFLFPTSAQPLAAWCTRSEMLKEKKVGIKRLT